MNAYERILALDMASTLGWALSASGIVDSGSQDFHRKPPTKLRPAQHVGESHAMFYRWLSGKLSDDKPTLIVYEGAGYFKSAAAAQLCIGFRGIMLMQSARLGIPVVSYAPKEVKKWWCGNGNADKPMMMAETRRRCPDLDLTDDNQSDAVALLHLHLSRTK